MALIPYDPFRHVDHWKNNLDKFFNEIPAAFGFNQEFGSPRMDVHETATEVIAHCEIPGLESKEDVYIDVDNNMLTINGVMNRSNEVKDDQYHRKERFSGRFHRSISLPAQVQAEGTTASYKNGILEVRMMKSKAAEKKHIDVQFH
jgi:HSP20 family protein